MELDGTRGMAIDIHDICVIVWTEESHLKHTGNLEKDEFLETTFSVTKLK